jgi:hypothetical protein
MDNSFYTYAYLRKDGTPYYIGKGKGYRAFHKKKREIKVPPVERILFLKRNLTEEEAFKHEIYMIALYGRKDLGTGILRNVTDGGEGTSGWKATPEFREKRRQAMLGRKQTPESIEKTRQKVLGIKRRPETIQKLKENCFKPVGYFWITDGKDEEWVAPQSTIPKGWCKGRKPVSEETRQKKIGKTTGSKNGMFGVKPKSASMRWYNLDNKVECMYIPGEEPEKWVTGRVKGRKRKVR